MMATDAGAEEYYPREEGVYTFSPLNEAGALAIREWRYPEPYSIYDMNPDPRGLAELLDPRSPHYAVRDERGELAGFFAFGTSAQLWSSAEPSLFSEGRAITVGLGMRPDLTGRGDGLAFVLAGLDFARRQFAPDAFRLFVATFNERATRVYERAGFHKVGIYVQRQGRGERNFWEMRRPANVFDEPGSNAKEGAL